MSVGVGPTNEAAKPLPAGLLHRPGSDVVRLGDGRAPVTEGLRHGVRRRPGLGGQGRMDPAHTVSGHLGHIDQPAQALDVAPNPAPLPWEQPVVLAPADRLRPRVQEFLQFLWDFDDALRVVGLALVDPQEPAPVVYISRTDVDHLTRAHGQVQRDQCTERTVAVATLPPGGALLIGHVRLSERQFDEQAGFVHAQLLLALALLALRFHIRERIATNPALRHAPAHEGLGLPQVALMSIWLHLLDTRRVHGLCLALGDAHQRDVQIADQTLDVQPGRTERAVLVALLIALVRDVLLKCLVHGHRSSGHSLRFGEVVFGALLVVEGFLVIGFGVASLFDLALDGLAEFERFALSRKRFILFLAATSCGDNDLKSPSPSVFVWSVHMFSWHVLHSLEWGDWGGAQHFPCAARIPRRSISSTKSGTRIAANSCNLFEFTISPSHAMGVRSRIRLASARAGEPRGLAGSGGCARRRIAMAS